MAEELKINTIESKKSFDETTWESIYETLYPINVSNLLKEKNDLKYLPWASAWSILLQHYPKATYEIHEFADAEGNMLPFRDLGDLGAMVETSVTIEGFTRTMWLPIMDSSNKAMKRKPYTYTVKSKWNGGKAIEKTVEAYDMMDINKSTLRCLVKNLAMFGLGLNVYEGEDIPVDDENPKDKNNKQAKKNNQPKNQVQNEEEQPQRANQTTVARATPNQINYLKKLFVGNEQLLNGYLAQLQCKNIEELNQSTASQLIDIGKKLQNQRKES